MEEFARSLGNAFDKYFSHYGEKQVHLWLLTTHPDFRRRGAGSMLCRWGMAVAEQQGRPVTVLASPLGRQLYERLGFDFLGDVIVQVDGEQDRLVVGCLEKSETTRGQIKLHH